MTNKIEELEMLIKNQEAILAATKEAQALLVKKIAEWVLGLEA